MNISDIDSGPIVYAKSVEPQSNVEEEEELVPSKQYKISTREFNISEITFWDQVGITQEVLKRFNVVVDRAHQKSHWQRNEKATYEGVECATFWAGRRRFPVGVECTARATWV